MNYTPIFLKNKVIMPTSRGAIICPYDYILYIYSDRPYTMVKLRNQRAPVAILVPIKSILENLPFAFFLCNRSVIVNMNYIFQYARRKNQLIVKMSDEELFEIALKRQKEFLHKMNDIYNLSERCSYCHKYKFLIQKI